MYNIKSVKLMGGAETQRYTCSLFRGSRKVALVHNTGDGKCLMFSWRDKDTMKAVYRGRDWHGTEFTLKMTPEEKRLKGFCDNCPPHVEKGVAMDMTPDLLLNIMVCRYESNRQLKGLCREGIVYRLIGDEPGKWRIIHKTYSRSTILPFLLSVSDTLEEIANTRFTD